MGRVVMLASGTRIGSYEVVAPLGKGGMGEVYRARDSRLKRDVAIKILPGLLAGDPERQARFQREAEILAALDHPSIAGIHGLEDVGGSVALVLEIVEGETLAERIERGPVPLDEALPMADQIAAALEYAHERGVVHRDLKPSNIKLTPEGTVKVLDFGLAKLTDDRSPLSIDASASPTMTAMSLAGVLLGTAAYMSPEQARGKAADKRSDVWAFGGNDPMWSRTRNEILFSTLTDSREGKVMVAPYRIAGGRFEPERPSPLHDAVVSVTPMAGRIARFLDLHPDGERLAVALRPSGPAQRESADAPAVILIQNFSDDLRRRMPGR